MPIKRHFLDFNQPALKSASRYLIDAHSQHGPADFTDVVVVVPAGRAGRHLRARLLEETKRQGRGLIPPRIVTVSHLPELLYQPKRPFASTWVQHLAWTTALIRSDRSVRARIAPALAELEAKSATAASAHQPSATEARGSYDEISIDEGWLDVGRMLWRQYRELTAEALSFADVAERGNSLEGFFESARWHALAAVQNEYLRALDAEGIWDKQTARLVAVRHHECHFDGQLVLLGTVDLNRTMRQMLDQVSEQVTALIHAPPAWEERFDEHGCVIPETWEEARIDFADEQWSVAYGPQEQGQRIVEILREFDGRFAESEVVIGCADANLIPFVQRSLSQAEVASTWSGGMPLERSGPVKLLQVLGDLLEGMRFSRFSAWVRHPDVVRWMASKKLFPLAQIDRYYNHFLPARWTEPVRGDRKTHEKAHLAIEHTRTLLSGLREPRLPVTAWMPRIQKVIEAIYATQSIDLNDAELRAKYEACRVIDDAMAGISELPMSLAMEVTATQAIRLIVAAVAGEKVVEAEPDAGIELLGWLDLPLDDAPALIVTGFNEKIVPQSVTSDLFLPDRLRQHLDINDNRRRYARDAYAFSVLLGSRKSISVITCQNDRHGEPLLPSRLLFCCDDETRAARWLRFGQMMTASTSPPAATPQIPEATSPAASDRTALITTPLPDDRAPLPASLSVTGFKSYLQCPYLFYLQRVLGLRFVDDEARELAGDRFGTIIHTALEQFGRSAISRSDDASEIYHAVERALRKTSAEVCGDAPLAAVQVQIEQALARLKKFAIEQARLRNAGWKIDCVESEELVEVSWDVDGEPFTIHGKIDRIDVHEETGQVRLIDYKTGDAGIDLDKLWTEEQGWTDLQLPLYRHLAEKLGYAGPFEGAYFVLPKRTEQTTLLPVPWTEEQLAAADEQAREVIRAIRRREFWPPAEQRPPFSADWDDFVRPIAHC